MPNVITVYTDASHCPETRAGGWACWIKYTKFETISASGFFKEGCYDSTEAEIKAIANAVSIVVKRLKPKDAIIVVVTDSAMAQAFITVGVEKRAKNAGTWEVKAALASHVKKLIPIGCELRINKVKAHTKSDGKRSYVNGMVDKMAYAELKKARKVAA